MKEAYVKLETAKLLREKGFPQSTSICNVVYKPNGKMSFNAKSFINPCYLFKDWYIFAPTQQMVCDWLTEEKGMYISVVPDFNEYGEYPDDLYWFARVYDLIKGDYIHSTKLCISSQEAFETAIQYVLTNLI